MKKSDMDFLSKFAAASSAAFLLSGCTSEIERAPSPDSSESAETQNSSVTAPSEQPAFRTVTVCLYGPPPRSKNVEGVNQNIESELKLNAIYWNPANPLVTINDNNYRVGDTVNGYTILEIRETLVVLRSPLGDKIVKNFYDYLGD